MITFYLYEGHKKIGLQIRRTRQRMYRTFRSIWITEFILFKVDAPIPFIQCVEILWTSTFFQAARQLTRRVQNTVLMPLRDYTES